MKEVFPSSSGDAGAGHDPCRGPACPRCNGTAYRVPRRFMDVLMSLFIQVRRYRCDSPDCGWEGNRRVKRRPLAIRGPW